ncbi:LOW QUALITY PROTEIN: DNA-directed RNA polymerase II subunit GRINL1A [Drosophila tropicalis]|uniref:LOW QUALITY PROTEIN: DNA-directed RNA polymerase II subunit GRINL1A n=1 Tax=Drosophila tropicalis TaxID=46794 RepID=UPI0035ABB6AD
MTMTDKLVPAPLSRIPGTSQVKEKHCKDLKTLNYLELLDMKERQGKFLTFKKRLDQLPDKGKRLKESYAKLLDEIKRRDDVEAAARMLSELNIASKGRVALDNLEWNGKMTDDHVADILDSDDELEMDPLKIIAQGTMHEKKVKVLPAEATLITAEDLAEIETFKGASASPDSTVPADLIEVKLSRLALTKETNHSVPTPALSLEQHALYLIDKTEHQRSGDDPPVREKFKPFRTTVSNVHDPDKERVRKKGKHWEITAATPPLIQHKEVQLVPLAESANLQVDYMQRIKELKIKQAEERLARRGATKNLPALALPSDSILKTKESFQNYRNPQIDYLIEGKTKAAEANEVLDPTTTEASGTSGIHYTVYE